MDNLKPLPNRNRRIHRVRGRTNTFKSKRRPLAAKINVSKFSLFIGLLALALAGSGLAGFELPFIPTVIVLVGLFVVAEALQKSINKKPMQT